MYRHGWVCILMAWLSSQESCSDARGEMLKSTVLLLSHISVWTFQQYDTGISHHITDSMMSSLLLCLSVEKCLRREQSIYFPLLLTESVPMALHTLAGTRLLHHPSIASLVQQPPHQNPNQLTGWHFNFSTDNADDVVAMVDWNVT